MQLTAEEYWHMRALEAEVLVMTVRLQEAQQAARACSLAIGHRCGLPAGGQYTVNPLTLQVTPIEDARARMADSPPSAP